MKKIAITTLLSTTLSVSLVWAHPQFGKFEEGFEILNLYKKLDLTEEQRNTINTLVSPYRHARQMMHDLQLNTEGRRIMQEQFDDVACIEAFNQRQQASLPRRLERARLQHSLYQVLNNQQKAKLETLNKKRRVRIRSMKQKGIEKNLDHLDLDDNQLEQISTLYTEHQQKHSDAHIMKENFHQLRRDIIRQPVFNENQWLALETKYQQVKLEIALQKAKYHHDIMNVLTDEQRDLHSSLDHPEPDPSHCL